jgi:aminoglycoside 6'-N-acetyltransferase I
MHIRPYRDTDWNEWLRLNSALFPDEPHAALEAGMRECRRRPHAEVFVLERADGTLAGFVEAGTRPFADGCDTSPVGFIEAWYVDPDLRRQGHGRALLAAAETWARERGYTEMASDALLENEISHRAHQRAGYVEVERAVRFRKPLA